MDDLGVHVCFCNIHYFKEVQPNTDNPSIIFYGLYYDVGYCMERWSATYGNVMDEHTPKFIRCFCWSIYLYQIIA